MASLGVDAYSLNGVKTIEAEYWITNLHAKDDNGQLEAEHRQGYCR